MRGKGACKAIPYSLYSGWCPYASWAWVHNNCEKEGARGHLSYCLATLRFVLLVHICKKEHTCLVQNAIGLLVPSSVLQDSS